MSRPGFALRAHRSPILVAMIGDATARGLAHLIPAMLSGELLVLDYIKIAEAKS